MKRLHVHLGVADLERSIRFYSALFAAEPSLRQADYAKWQLDDPRVNFAISTRGKKPGLDHLGIQAESDAELDELGTRLAQADVAVLPQKYWTLDPQGVAWESFHTLDSIPVFGADTASQVRGEKAACCAPSAPALED
jgi:catechol 2,3-dioxygenase-like lactoylglutathione lyase family enzyme